MPTLAYVGSYTRSRGRGIVVYDHDPATGAFEHRQTVPEHDPSFLAFHPTQDVLFAVSEGLGRDNGAVAAFAIASTGQLSPLNRQPTGGGEPCHLATDVSGRWLLVANHEHGSVAVFPIESNGHIGPRSNLHQHLGEAPHAHFVQPESSGTMLVTDKGLDQVLRYSIGDDGTLVPGNPHVMHLHPGAAPRHVSVHPSGRFIYVNGEADMTINAFAYPDGVREFQSLSTLPADSDRQGYSTAQILVEPSGRFVYVSNRGHDSIACFAIDGTTGELTPRGNVPTQGRTPRNFAIDPSGRRLYAANQNSDTIVVFAIDPDSGALEPTGQVVEVGAPVCIVFRYK